MTAGPDGEGEDWSGGGVGLVVTAVAVSLSIMILVIVVTVCVRNKWCRKPYINVPNYDYAGKQAMGLQHQGLPMSTIGPPSQNQHTFAHQSSRDTQITTMSGPGGYIRDSRYAF